MVWTRLQTTTEHSWCCCQIHQKGREVIERCGSWLDNIKDITRLSVDNLLDSTQDRTQ